MDPMMCQRNSASGAQATSHQPPATGHGLSLFTNTRRMACDVAATSIPRRYAQILDLLRTRGPMTLWEVAAAMGVHDHQISGRISELKEKLLIEATGERRKKPSTGCEADVYRLRQPLESEPVADVLGYPSTVKLDDTVFDRSEILPNETLPGIPYSRRGDVRITYRLLIVRCPICGGVLRQVETHPKRIYRCGGPDCGRLRWEGALATEPGQSPILSILLRTL